MNTKSETKTAANDSDMKAAEAKPTKKMAADGLTEANQGIYAEKKEEPVLGEAAPAAVKRRGRKPASTPSDARKDPAEPKRAYVRKSAAAKKTGIKAAEKKASVKKAGTRKPMIRKNVKSDVFIEFNGKQIAANDILSAAKSDFEARHNGVIVKSMEIYVKPEESTAYYVVNGDGCDQFKVDL